VKLTRRQKGLLGQAIDLYREVCRPFHYSEVARKLGLSSSTAYDMLRLLEQKGLVQSEYTLKEAAGPGRSSLRFSPTAKAMELFHRLAGDTVEQEEWEEVKARILAALRRGQAADHSSLLKDLLSRIPEARSPLAFCAEVITALLLSLREAKYKFGEHNPLAMLLTTPLSRLGMGMLAGMAIGLVFADRMCRQLFGNLSEYTVRYETSLQELPPEKLETLQEFTQEVMAALAFGGK